MKNELHLSLLGRLEISQEGTPIERFAHNKSLALLCYLAVTGRPHTRTALAGMLWSEATEANALAGLRKVLADLRQQVAPHLIITRRQVALNREQPYWLDVEAFEQQINEIETVQGAGLLPTGVVMPTDAARLAEAVDLYRGDFLAGFHVRRALVFEEWVLLQRERLRLTALRALHVLASHHMAQGTYPQVIEYSKRILALEPCQEEAHRQMMSALALGGQHQAALRQYQICCRALAEEMGTTPQKETTVLYKRIRDGEATALRAPAAGQNLPCPPIPLIGREKERDEIIARLHAPDCRLLTLIGPGGSGKTRLAQEIAATLSTETDRRPGDPDEVYLVSLAPLRSAESLVPTIAQGMGFLFSRESDLRHQLLDYLRQKHLLLILDNFEHLLPPTPSPTSPPAGGMKGGAGLVSDILTTAPNVKILVTSRARLNLQIEHLYLLAGLDCSALAPGPSPKSETEEPRYATQCSAVQLFLWGAHRVRPDLEPTSDDYGAIGRICRLAEGMPLAILLAASWARMLTPAEIAAQLASTMSDVAGGALGFLETDWGDVPARQRSMRSVFDHSWNLLTDREREALAALSVFRGGFAHEAARQVTGASLRELMGLADRSLVHRAGGRYEMHELLRQYAADQLRRAEKLETAESVHERHNAYYASKLQKWAADLKSDRQIAALEEMEAEIANVRAAWDWMVSQASVARLDLALEGLCLVYEWHGRYQEGKSACQAAAQALSRPSLAQSRKNGAVKRMLAKVLAWQGVFSETEHASQLFQESLALLEDAELAEQDTGLEKAFVLLKMGCLAEGDMPSLEQSLAIYRTFDDRWGTAQALEALGWLAWNSGIYDKMEQLYQESLTIYQSLGDQRGIATSSQWLGVASLYQGRLEGERLVREGITIYQEIGERVRMVHGLNIAGLGLLSLGKFAETHAFLEKSVALSDDLGRSDPFTNMLLGGAKVHLGQYEQGRAWGQTVLNAAQGFDRSSIGFPLIVLGWVALAREAYPEAQRLFQEGADACRDVEQRELLSWVLAFLGYADRGLGQFVRAGRHLLQALQMAIDIQSFVGSVFTLPGIALLLADLGQKERAVELYALASRYPVVANSRWFTDVIGRRIATVTAGLPPDIVAAAEERGRARDLEATMKELLTELEESLSSCEFAI